MTTMDVDPDDRDDVERAEWWFRCTDCGEDFYTGEICECHVPVEDETPVVVAPALCGLGLNGLRCTLAPLHPGPHSWMPERLSA